MQLWRAQQAARVAVHSGFFRSPVESESISRPVKGWVTCTCAGIHASFAATCVSRAGVAHLPGRTASRICVLAVLHVACVPAHGGYAGCFDGFRMRCRLQLKHFCLSCCCHDVTAIGESAVSGTEPCNDPPGSAACPSRHSPSCTHSAIEVCQSARSSGFTSACCTLLLAASTCV